MTLYPAARVRLLPESGTQPGIRPTQVILHTAVSRSASLYSFFANGTNLESHFYVAADGVVEQYVDTTTRADANYTANLRPDGTGAISVETAGMADEPWTTAQLDALRALLDWCHTTHTIPLTVCTGPSAPGVGWHVMFGSPGPWTPVSKTCPGPKRIAQIPELLGDDMPTVDDIVKGLLNANLGTSGPTVGIALQRTYTGVSALAGNEAAVVTKAVTDALIADPKVPLTAAQTDAIAAAVLVGLKAALPGP